MSESRTNSVRETPPQFATPREEFRLGDYLVTVDESGVFFQRLVAPRCGGRILAFENYWFNDGEVFFGPANECIVSLEWEDGEPEEDEFNEIVGHFDKDLADWRSWNVKAEGFRQDPTRPATRTQRPTDAIIR
jgi:hypothetical protein